MTIRLNRRETEGLLGRIICFDCLDDFAEVVHLEISARCQLACPYCYVGEDGGGELSTSQWERIFDDLAGYGVFQVTFGGGEPTLRSDLKELALSARRVGLNLCMTTNGINLPYLEADVLCLFNQVNVSYHHTAPHDTFRAALAHLRHCHVPAGINFLVTRGYTPVLPAIAEISRELDAELLLLSAKGVSDAFPSEEVWDLAKRLHESGLKVAVDSLSCRGVIPDFCLQKIRFCTVDALGNVMPCSFVREPALGSLPRQSFAEIWRSRGRQVPCPYA